MIITSMAIAVVIAILWLLAILVGAVVGLVLLLGANEGRSLRRTAGWVVVVLTVLLSAGFLYVVTGAWAIMSEVSGATF